MSGPEYDYPSYGTGPKTCPECGGSATGMSAYFRWGKIFCSYECSEKWTAKRSLMTPPPVCGACLKDLEDPVLSPSHYTHGGIETIDFIRAKLTPDEFRGFCKGSVIKYLSRANLKGNEDQDYRKASFYATMLAGKDPRGEAE